ncbi:sugar kinase [Mameliella sediminis]|uniref:sugar kinase n=1 Tax=Mameliella sediminis TaxID=2836866 RepID=UPI001C495C9C|nr:sugar kinase [Mameliella sediminis]MBY6115912.1 sugar kinase [Antarctobacter heliothermus]MBY6145310.1 sugar kinase [Mameliella alba]MBV7393966.1 sugar kinase [Mameliella sediminis]MBY6162120.1 sugar kinase [Mameliella alba]MBY6170590.1 sugar kinase [Mameliella alba]
MTRFLSLGEIMVEMAPAPENPGLYRLGYAGDTFNTAWYARRLLPATWTVSYGTVLGEDAMSDDLARFIGAQGLSNDALRRTPDRTAGLYMIQTRDGERSFSYWRGQSAAKLLADDPDWLDQILADRAMIQFSGISLAILAPEARKTLCAALGRARAAGAHVAFDTNLRPRLWESAEAMRSGLLMGASVSDTVLPSFDEEQLAFGDASPEDTVQRYRASGATCVVIKNGGAPCHGWSETDGTVTTTPPTVARIVDSTAAGDSFGAGFLAARATGASLATAMTRAAALAAQVIQHPGALAPQIFETGEPA